MAHQVGDDLVFGLALLNGALVLGFFLVNFPHGKIFLGDGGAYFCGFLLAALGVLLPARNPEVSAWTAILICAYPVIETLASMRRKAKRDGHSVGQPDRVHFHMLAHRRYARRLVKRHRGTHLRNPATSLVTWFAAGALTAGFAAIGLRERRAERRVLLPHRLHLRADLPRDVAQRPAASPGSRTAPVRAGRGRRLQSKIA